MSPHVWLMPRGSAPRLWLHPDDPMGPISNLAVEINPSLVGTPSSSLCAKTQAELKRSGGGKNSGKANAKGAQGMGTQHLQLMHQRNSELEQEVLQIIYACTSLARRWNLFEAAATENDIGSVLAAAFLWR